MAPHLSGKKCSPTRAADSRFDQQMGLMDRKYQELEAREAYVHTGQWTQAIMIGKPAFKSSFQPRYLLSDFIAYD